MRLGFNDLQVVLETIAGPGRADIARGERRSHGKIEANTLSESVGTLLKAGMAKAPLVESFFRQWHDEALGERIASPSTKMPGVAQRISTQ